jgi:hypothetical protein
MYILYVLHITVMTQVELLHSGNSGNTDLPTTYIIIVWTLDTVLHIYTGVLHNINQVQHLILYTGASNR